MPLLSLVADDVRNSRMLAAGWLSEMGHETVLAASGDEALQILYERRFDLLVTDIEMPGRSGFDVLLKLRHQASDELSRIPVIVMSSLQDASLEETALDFGATGCIHKPLIKREFQALVNRVMGRSVAQDSCSLDKRPKTQGGSVSPTLRRLVDRAKRLGEDPE